MSEDPYGILAYGFHLGGPISGWGFPNFPAWIDTKESFDLQLEDKLLAEIVGFDETWESIRGTDKQEGYYGRYKAANERLGIQVVRYGSWLYPNYILATKVMKTDEYGALPVDVFLDHSAAERLTKALDVLGIVPMQLEPKWILATFYG